MNEVLYPLRFKPVYKDYVWGGDRIIRKYARGESSGVYAESWELADRDDGMSIVAHGQLKGRSLRFLCETFGAALTGTRAGTGRFPILLKILDARETLSVQVHPDDEAAAMHGGEAKSEMWHVLEADPGACVYDGFVPGVTAASFKEALKSNHLEALLNKRLVKAGDTIFMPGGRVHAIGAGCLLLEIQQNSNTTYRIHDWGRLGADGQPREVHLDQALKVIRWDNGNSDVSRRSLFHFETREIGQSTRMESDLHTFRIVFVIKGSIRVGPATLSAGETVLLPAAVAASIDPVEPSVIAQISLP